MKGLYTILILCLIVSCKTTQKATETAKTNQTLPHQQVEPVIQGETNYTPKDGNGYPEKAIVKEDTVDRGKLIYEEAYQELIRMLEGSKSYSFKEAVYLVEGAYLENEFDKKAVERQVQGVVRLSEEFIKTNSDGFHYDYEDRETILKHSAIFKVMTDTLFLLKKEGKNFLAHLPYKYNFDDMWGRKDWTAMFVSKLLATHKGNCHSLPYLYKIIAEELDIKTHLAIAPNHIYIKHRSKKTGMYNTELTSAAFPIDAWLMASGYIHLDAIRNGIYMDGLNNTQSVALCLFDLAKGFERKYGDTNDTFILKCLEKVLEYYPNCINALLFKSEILKRKMDRVDELSAKQIFIEYEKLIVQIHRLGYRKMPEDMYMDWLLDLKEHQEKYVNKKVIENFNTNNSN